MSGHSKWSNIKHKKEKTDAQKGKIFTKLGREITVAVKSGGADPETNRKLKDIIAKARSNNMPNDNIQRCIKKALGDGNDDNYENITYEGYGPSGVAVIVETLTDNRNRTAGDLRHYFDKFGGNLGTNGSVSWMFDKKGKIIILKGSDIDEDTIMMDALDAGAEDFEVDDEFYEITTTPDDFSDVVSKLEEKNYAYASAEVEMIPQTYVKLTDAHDVLMMEKLIENLEDNDDVQDIYHNWEEEE
ncbi:MAG: YebC/PmpR family DNA-binding transcriptional regulator [Ruminococcaceae bacterium]|nr:YebC/PmpR family DNA-binding transcriptional regulator [Oscillospiraceae bacterium]